MRLYIGTLSLTLVITLSGLGCGFKLVGSNHSQAIQPITVAIVGDIDYETELVFIQELEKRDILVNAQDPQIVIDFKSISVTERAIRFDQRGNAIEFAKRVEWQIQFGDVAKKVQVVRTLQGTTQYRQDEATLLATSNQQAIAFSQLNRELAADLINLLYLELSNGSLSGAT